MIVTETSEHTSPEPLRIVAVSAGTGEPSTTRMLSDRILRSVLTQLEHQHRPVSTHTLELRHLAVDTAEAINSGIPSKQVQQAIDQLATADALIMSTPVYKAGIAGPFKSFIDLLDNDLLIAKPVILAATAGSSRHALVADDQMRSLFAFMRTFTTPTSVFAAPEDWNDTALNTRVDRDAVELTALITNGVTATVTKGSWSRYQHTFGGNAQPDGVNALAIDLDTDLMRLATGG